MSTVPTVRLDPARAAGLGALVAEIAGRPAAGQPWLAPALLFSDPAVQAQLRMPRPGAGEILVHDYQSVTRAADLPTGVDLIARTSRSDRDATTEFEISLHADAGDAVVATLKTALRRVARRDLAALRPAHLPEALTAGDAGRAAGLSVTQAQVDAYVALSGDTNPIHRDPAEARALGLPAPIVPGLLLAATIQPLAPSPLATFKCRFMAPLCVGAPYSVALTARAPQRARAVLFAEGRRALAIADLQFRG